MAANAYQIGQLVAQLGLNNAQFMAGMDAAITKMGAADAAMKKASLSMQAQMTAISNKAIATGKMMTRGLTIPLIAIGAGAAKTFASFEASMAKIVGLVGVAEEQVDVWKDSVKDLAVEMGRSPTELADALFFITSAGLRGAEAMDVLAMSAKASVAGLGETKVVADLLTSSMNAYGAATLPAAKAADILTAAVRAGKAEADSIAGAMGNVIPISSAMGMTFADLSGSIAGMTRTGTPAVKAATQLKAILSAMASPSEKAEKAMNDMGYSSEQFRRTLKEKGFIEALDELKMTTDQFGGETALAKVFPNIRALVGVFDLLGANLEENRKVYDEVRNSAGILDEAYGAMAGTLKEQFNVAMATVKSTLTELGEAMKGPIVKALQGIGQRLQKVTDGWKNLTEAQKQAKLRMAGLIAIAGPLLTIMGKIGKAALANPWGALAVAIITVVMAIVRFIKTNREIFDGLSGIENATKKANKQFFEQTSRVRVLTKVIENENISNAKRIEAINELKRIVPEYNGMITKEGELINHNTGAIEDYLAALKEKIKLQAYEEEYTRLLKRQFELQSKIIDASIKASGIGFGATAAQANLARLNKQYDKNEEAIQEMNAAAKDLNITLGQTPAPEVELPTEGTPGAVPAAAVGGDPIVDLKAREDAKTQLIQAAENERASIIQNSFARQRQEEILAFERQKEIFEQMGTEFPALRVQVDEAIEALAAGHQSRLATIAQLGWKAVIKESMEGANTEMDAFKKHFEEMTEIANAWETAGGQLATVFNGIGSAIGLANNQAAQWISYVGRILSSVAGLIGTIKKLVLAKEAEATAEAIASGAKLPFPANLIAIAASVASVLASFASIPKLAAGGLAYGKTLAEVGEYPGAGSNPEVIAPLSDLKKLIQPANTFGLPETIELTLSGRNASALINFEEMLKGTY